MNSYRARLARLEQRSEHGSSTAAAIELIQQRIEQLGIRDADPMDEGVSLFMEMIAAGIRK